MVRLREAKAQHTESKTNNNVEGRSLELSMIFKQVEENVYALREMEVGSCLVFMVFCDSLACVHISRQSQTPL